MRESGYPIGTKCVITHIPLSWTYSGMPTSVGDIVTLSSDAWIFWAGQTHVVSGAPARDAQEYGKLNGHLVQRVGVTAKRPDGSKINIVHPVYWMRPLDDDTDESDQEVIEMLRHNSVVRPKKRVS